MSNEVNGNQVISAMKRVINRVMALKDELNRLDAAIGDGDAGLTAVKGAVALEEYLASNPPIEDLGKLFSCVGLAINKAASSTLGTLTATALMRAGREASGMAELDDNTLARMLGAADKGVQERGKAKPGDKTIVDALHPAATAFSDAVEQGKSREIASRLMLDAARKGRDAAIPLRSKVGRSSWVGERTENKLDPGTVLLVNILEAIVDSLPQ
jgi:dihydroxyacetone kinase